MSLQPDVIEFLLSVAVKMAEVKNPERQEATLGEIAQWLGELGEWGMMRSLNAYRDRILTVLRMGE